MKSIFVLLVLSVLLVHYNESAPMYQMLPHKDGYVPVYIRLGDTPLEDINPELANAFHEYGISGRNIKSDLEDEMMADQPNASSVSSEEKDKNVAAESQDKPVESKPVGNQSISSKSSEESKEKVTLEGISTPVADKKPEEVAATDAKIV